MRPLNKHELRKLAPRLFKFSPNDAARVEEQMAAYIWAMHTPERKEKKLPPVARVPNALVDYSHEVLEALRGSDGMTVSEVLAATGLGQDHLRRLCMTMGQLVRLGKLIKVRRERTRDPNRLMEYRLA